MTRGHGVASGRTADSRFPDGTIAMQVSHFRERGLELGQYLPATINIAIAPHRYIVRKARETFRDVKWSPDVPAEPEGPHQRP